eukprot:12904028-Alexandrium_andersonii.AAC.1
MVREAEMCVLEPELCVHEVHDERAESSIDLAKDEFEAKQVEFAGLKGLSSELEAEGVEGFISLAED